MGSGDVLKLGFIARHQSKIVDSKIELYTTNGQSARCIAEEIIAYCQIKLAEGTKNNQIEVVRRNMTNLFEDVEDPFADDFVDPYSNKNNSKLGNRTKKGNEYGLLLDDVSMPYISHPHEMHNSMINKNKMILGQGNQVHSRGY